MTRRLPPIKTSTKILIICEGSEEFDYLCRLRSLNVWSHDFGVEVKNAHSIDKIADLYEYYYSLDSYKLIVVFCDTEKAPYNQFLAMQTKIQNFHDKKKITDHLVFFANPCTMQIVLSHFDKVTLKSNDKSENADLIRKLTGVKDYRAMEKQRKAIMDKLSPENYKAMEDRITQLSSDYRSIPGSNAIVLFSALDAGNMEWVKSIIKKIESQ